MKVEYISDLHLDFWIKEHNRSIKLESLIKQFCKSLELFGADVLIIAGDLGHYYVQDSLFLKYVKSIYKDVIIVNGNHDRYLVSNSTKSKYKLNSENRITEIKSFCRSNSIHYLDGDIISINGIKFGGVGMSWDKSFIEQLYARDVSKHEVLTLFRNTMNDSHNIYNKQNEAYFMKHYSNSQVSRFDPLDFYESELNKLKNIKDVDVIITHYGPCLPPNMSLEYANSNISTFFYFDGSKEIERINAKYWIHGHTHARADYVNKKTRILVNPLGYPGENSFSSVRSFEL